mgnify:CR=1 FL=1
MLPVNKIEVQIVRSEFRQRLFDNRIDVLGVVE